MNEKTTIGILGIGAIGTVVSVALQQSGRNELYYYSRSQKESLQLLQSDEIIKIPIEVSTTLTTSPTLDWLVICLKTYHYAAAKPWFSALISPKTKVAVIRNGLRLKDGLLPFAPEQHILECMIDCPTQFQDNGFYQSFKKPQITVPDGMLAQDFALLFNKKEAEINLVSDFKTENWKKLCESVALGAILCLTGETCWIFKDEKLITLYLGLLDETLQVAIADGAKIVTNYKDKMLAKLLNYPPNKGSSMLTDRLNGNPIELDAKNGIISTLGKRYDIETPLNDIFVNLLKYTNQKM